ncbi:MAG: 3-ketoacyl-ACP reductase [Candidatus Bipolaricaulota bacterium]|nr:3-ketoacyl-ACP reductase [Candidatus Bipolaricaulota bacterium]
MNINDDQVALITGSARGIGRGIALELAKQGINIAVNDLTCDEDAEETVRECRNQGVSAGFFLADISDSTAREELIEEVKNEFGRLDMLINNAGVSPEERKDLLEASEESFDRLIEVNLKGPYFLTQLASKWMIKQKQKYPERDMFIVNISSISAYTSSPERGEYCVSKAGISMMTKLYADRLADEGINVYEIRPGIIRTSMTRSVTDKYDRLIKEEGITPIRRWGEPEDIGKAVVALAKGYHLYSTGEVFNLDGGFHLQRL